MPNIIKAKPGQKVPVLKSQVTLIGAKKSDQVVGVLNNGTDNQIEDTFTGSYTTQGNLGSVSIIEPTFLPLQLHNLVTKNNILNQCVEAMEVNIDGTGHDFELVVKPEDGGDKEAKEDTEKKALMDFFNEPYPGKSMISIRRALRRDMESNGWGVMEVIRAINGEIIMLNYAEAEVTRLVRLDNPTFVDKTITRNGKEMTVKIRARERRFCQMVNGKKVYFKEFGASRELDRDTGQWAEPGVKLSIAKRASELLYFAVNKEVRTPYGSPRWINQLPSVIGSRRAEEHNLDFFDAGGLPPVLVLVQGGYLGTDVKASLEAHLSGSGGKHRAAVVEAIAASGSLDSSGTVKVTVERFGTERQQDAMFMDYDKNCEEHVRTAFRLPPLFVGRAEDYNFATALTGYMIAEAQVFAPERVEFDERINHVIRAMGFKKYKFKSHPITLKDAENQLKAIELGLTNKVITPESAVEHMNKLTGQELEWQDPPDPVEEVAGIEDAKLKPKLKVMDKQHQQSKEMVKVTHQNTKELTEAQLAAQREAADKKTTVKKEDVTHLVFLAEAWGSVLGLRGPCPYDAERIETVKKAVGELQGAELHVFNEILASKTLVGVDETTEGIAQLCGAAAHLMVEA